MKNLEPKQLHGFSVKEKRVQYGLVIEPGLAGDALVRPMAGMPRQQFERQYHILQGYVLLALGRQPEPGETVALEGLALPQEEGPEALAAVWFSRACQGGDAAKVVMAVYNGFGALPGGFSAVERRAEEYLGKETGERFMSWVKGAKTEENDLFERTPEPVGQAFWDEVDTKMLCRGLRKACLEYRSGQSQP